MACVIGMAMRNSTCTVMGAITTIPLTVGCPRASNRQPPCSSRSILSASSPGKDFVAKLAQPQPQLWCGKNTYIAIDKSYLSLAFT